MPHRRPLWNLLWEFTSKLNQVFILTWNVSIWYNSIRQVYNICREVNRLARLVYLICGAIVLFISLLLINLINPFNLADHSDQEELKTEQVAEKEVADNSIEEENENEDSDIKEPSGSSTAPTSGSGFKHEVQMNIDGVVEKNQDEGWWVID